MDVTSLNRKRGNIKGQVTRLENALQDKNVGELTLPELQAQLDVVLKLQEKFEILKSDYYKNANETEFSEAEVALDSIEEDLQNLEVSLKTSINKLKYNVEYLKGQNIDSSTKDAHTANNDQPKRATIKLPEIPLPLFNGKFEEWNLFKTQFNSLINENAELSEHEKLHYLRGCLKGEAKIIETSDDDFTSLFKALEQRYENKRVIVDCHIKNILNFPAMKHESAKDLRILLDNIKRNLRSLKILDFNRDKLSNTLLLNIVLDKLDRETRKQYELTLKDNEVPDFDVCLEFLERRYQILSSINSNIPAKLNTERSKSLFIKSNKSKTCIACKTLTHALYQCDKFKSMKLSDRLDLVKKHRLCFNCLSEFHIISACNSKSSCFVCKKKHHTLLHKYAIPERNPNAVDDRQAPNEHMAETINSSEIIDSTSENARASFHTNGNSKGVLINTAIVYVKDSFGRRKPLRAILDSASESSFISSRAADALGLPKERINIPVSGLNDSAINIKRKISSQISNEKNDSQWEIDLMIVPKISHSLLLRKLIFHI
ncbi:unnamed protein product [Larinioides sclopetarius]|uniref:Peptidase aspartic putative domain-containing protein n=1 Tax=Larinioides sclopetarius TaxID=280406 RepID=A0AAV1YVL8_9ARAC